jgi:hypothetical protein
MSLDSGVWLVPISLAGGSALLWVGARVERLIEPSEPSNPRVSKLTPPTLLTFRRNSR